ncbi:hypothetical protein AgCh_008123 [Apium graveolens]
MNPKGLHKGWHVTLNRDSMSFDSMIGKGLREYRRNDSRITLEVLQGERIRSVLHESGMVIMLPPSNDLIRHDEVVERKMLGPAVVQRTRDIIDLIRGRLVVARKDIRKLMRFGKKGKLSPPIVGSLDILRSIGKLAYELALPQNM